MLVSRDKQDPNEVNMKSLDEWREEEQINELAQDGQNPMDIVRQTMARIAPIVQLAHQQIESWPEEREKKKGIRFGLIYLDFQLMKNRSCKYNNYVQEKKKKHTQR